MTARSRKPKAPESGLFPLLADATPVVDDPRGQPREVSPGFDEPFDMAHVPEDLKDRYEVHSWRNAATIMDAGHQEEWADVMAILRAFRLRKSYVVKDKDDDEEEDSPEEAEGGGNKSKLSKALDSAFYGHGWFETIFHTEIDVKAERRTSRDKKAPGEEFAVQKYRAPTHYIDCYKHRVGLEVQWNNKDPFYDRDLNNFRLLFELRVIDVGIIITRCTELKDFFKKVLPKGAHTKYSANTTHMGKLMPLLQGGSGGGCPVLVFGLTPKLYDATS
jgi:hypothetical protein